MSDGPKTKIERALPPLIFAQISIYPRARTRRYKESEEWDRHMDRHTTFFGTHSHSLYSLLTKVSRLRNISSCFIEVDFFPKKWSQIATTGPKVQKMGFFN